MKIGRGKKRHDRLKVFTRRAAILGGLQGLLVAGLASRLYYLQVIENSRYKMLADENRISVRLIPPPRGRIIDRFGRVIASNRADYRAFLVPEQTNDLDHTLDALGEILRLTADDRARILEAVQRQRSFLPVTVAGNLSWEDFARLNMASPDLPGVQPDVGTTRYYPYGPLLSHVLGYVGSPNEQEAGRDPLLLMPGMRIGKSGIERTFEKELRGLAGNMKVEINAYGRVIRELEREEATPGRDLQLTLDLNLQKFAAERLSAEESASAVLMDIHNGDILALASMPSFDPNAFNVGIRASAWQELLNNERKPLVNKAVAGQYPPGSTFKMVVALAALEAGVIEPDHEVFCNGRRQLGNHMFHCWRRQGHGHVDLIGSLKHSCDIFYYDIADRVGIDKIAEMAQRLGLGQSFDISIPHVAAGLIPTRDWKLRATGSPWQRGETYVAGIGQGFTLSTPLQLAVMTARLANGGKAVMPRLVRPLVELAAAEPAPLGLPPEALQMVLRGMIEVTSVGGTAYAARITEPGYSMAGKTGTSQVRRITREERAAGIRRNEDKPWNERDHALFVGFGPIEAPRYACAVVVEHGGGGSSIAAPIARDILHKAMVNNSARPPVLPSPRQVPRSTRAV